MKKLLKALKAARLIARHPWLLNKVLDDDRRWQQDVGKKYRMQDGLPEIRLEELFGDFSETLFPYASLDGSSLPADLALLKKLAGDIENCAYFEIGTWRGESVANVAAVAKECFTLNLSAEEMERMNMDKEYIGLHRYFSAHLPNVTHLEGDSRTFDFGGLNKKFDLVFIDGDHHYDLVKNDTKKVFQHLVKENTIVVWHDYAYNPERIRYEVLAGILDGSPASIHHKIYHVANTMCAVYLQQEVTTKPFTSPQVPQGAFELRLGWKKSRNI